MRVAFGEPVEHGVDLINRGLDLDLAHTGIASGSLQDLAHIAQDVGHGRGFWRGQHGHGDNSNTPSGNPRRQQEKQIPEGLTASHAIHLPARTLPGLPQNPARMRRSANQLRFEK